MEKQIQTKVTLIANFKTLLKKFKEFKKQTTNNAIISYYQGKIEAYTEALSLVKQLQDDQYDLQDRDLKSIREKGVSNNQI